MSRRVKRTSVPFRIGRAMADERGGPREPNDYGQIARYARTAPMGPIHALRSRAPHARTSLRTGDGSSRERVKRAASATVENEGRAFDVAVRVEIEHDDVAARRLTRDVELRGARVERETLHDLTARDGERRSRPRAHRVSL